MQGRINLPAVCARALAEAMDSHTMTAVAREFIPSYDIHERTGFPPSIVIPSRDVAQQIVSDFHREGMLFDLISALIDIEQDGLMGRTYTIPYLRQIIQGAAQKGYIYDPENRIFVENPNVRKTRNWGALKEGREYPIAFLRLDIVGNSRLVRSYSSGLIERAYGALREIVTKAAERRNGRIWQWEGDGGLGAFFFANKDQRAALTAMEILHELHIYNRIACQLTEPLQVRIAVHSGPCEYTENDEALTRSATVKRVMEIEQYHTKPQTVTISSVVKVMLDAIVSGEFTQLEGGAEGTYFTYSLEWEG